MWSAAAYDRVAVAYDDCWSRHVEGPQRRLTDALRLRPGERVLDLACGTGVDTVEMSRRVRPGEVVGVDASEAMLVAAVERARREQLALTPVCGPVERVVASLPPRSFDVVSMRFALAYVDWHALLPLLGSLVRRGGRVGILTSLGSSAPQAYAVYRAMVDAVGAPDVALDVPRAADEVTEALERGGLRAEDVWEQTTPLTFPSGRAATSWLRDSGYAVHPVLDGLEPQVLAWLMDEFARRLEANAGGSAVVLDLHFAGVVSA